MLQSQMSSEFLQYLAKDAVEDGDSNQLPSLNELRDELGVSVSRLREQLEVAKAMGFVEVRPRTGIRRLPFSFLPAVRQSLSYAIKINRDHFEEFSDLRNHIEAAYWREAVVLLTPQDHEELKRLISRAWDKLRGPQIQIPHLEHRQLHMAVFCRLNNPFVLGILEAYWEAYEAIGLNIYAGYDYLQQVWRYHQEMVDAICEGDIERGYRALVEHKGLLYHRPIDTILASGESAS